MNTQLRLLIISIGMLCFVQIYPQSVARRISNEAEELATKVKSKAAGVAQKVTRELSAAAQRFDNMAKLWDAGLERLKKVKPDGAEKAEFAARIKIAENAAQQAKIGTEVAQAVDNVSVKLQSAKGQEAQALRGQLEKLKGTQEKIEANLKKLDAATDQVVSAQARKRLVRSLSEGAIPGLQRESKTLAGATDSLKASSKQFAEMSAALDNRVAQASNPAQKAGLQEAKVAVNDLQRVDNNLANLSSVARQLKENDAKLEQINILKKSIADAEKADPDLAKKLKADNKSLLDQEGKLKSIQKDLVRTADKNKLASTEDIKQMEAKYGKRSFWSKHKKKIILLGLGGTALGGVIALLSSGGDKKKPATDASASADQVASTTDQTGASTDTDTSDMSLEDLLKELGISDTTISTGTDTTTDATAFLSDPYADILNQYEVAGPITPLTTPATTSSDTTAPTTDLGTLPALP